MSKFVFIIGMPGSGKSTLGKKIANQLNIPFTDLDVYITNTSGLSIEQWFSSKGESAFRDREKQALEELIALQAAVISCGGGTPCYNQVIEYLTANGCVVYLKASTELLLHRLNKQGQQRPMFSGLNQEQIKNKLEDLLMEREGYYEQAHIHADVPVKSLESLVNAIKTRILQL